MLFPQTLRRKSKEWQERITNLKFRSRNTQNKPLLHDGVTSSFFWVSFTELITHSKNLKKTQLTLASQARKSYGFEIVSSHTATLYLKE